MIYGGIPLIGKAVISLESRRRVGQINGILINPQNLSVSGLWVRSRYEKINLILTIGEIRQLTSERVLIDSQDNLSDSSDLPKLKDVLRLRYNLIGKKIVTENRYIGVVSDFNFNNNTYEISHLIGSYRGLKRLKLEQLTFDRNQIVKVDSQKVVVDDGPQKQKVHSLGTIPN